MQNKKHKSKRSMLPSQHLFLRRARRGGGYKDPQQSCRTFQWHRVRSCRYLQQLARRLIVCVWLTIKIQIISIVTLSRLQTWSDMKRVKASCRASSSKGPEETRGRGSLLKLALKTRVTSKLPLVAEIPPLPILDCWMLHPGKTKNEQPL